MFFCRRRETPDKTALQKSLCRILKCLYLPVIQFPDLPEIKFQMSGF